MPTTAVQCYLLVVQTAEDLLAEWRSFPADGRRLLAIPRKGISAYDFVMTLIIVTGFFTETNESLEC